MMKLRKGIIGLTNSGRKRILPEFLSSLLYVCAHAHTHMYININTNNPKEKGRKKHL